MQIAEKERESKEREEGRNLGVDGRYMSGMNFPGINLWEKFSPETMTVRIMSSLFADDTTILGVEEVIKRTMADFEKQNNECKEETLYFGDMNEETKIMLGCWRGTREDLKKTKARVGNAWFQIK